MNQPLLPERRVLRSSEVCRRAGLCDMQLRRLERAGRFPKRFKLNPAAGARGATGWDSVEFEAWLDERKRSREAVHEPEAA